MDQKALFRFGYGLYVITARQDDFDNGCVINTAMQVTADPPRMFVAVNKKNKTHDMILKTGVFNVCMLAQNADFTLFERFGFQSGYQVDKFADFTQYERSDNGITYLTGQAGAYVSGKVMHSIDADTHTLFLADITDAKILSELPTVTYDFYQQHIKPKPEKTAGAGKKEAWVCVICGYVYEGDELPADFICPVCKHGVADFEKMNISD